MTEDLADLAVLRGLLESIQYAMLTTREPDGCLASRPLQTLGIDADASIWFFTSAASHKIEQLRREAHVNLSYADPAHKRFVAISGHAYLSVDALKAEQLWTATQRVFFPEGPRDANLVLLKVVPDTARYWDGNESALGLLLKFGRALLRNEASDLGACKDFDVKR